jgi:hypothetical protein
MASVALSAKPLIMGTQWPDSYLRQAQVSGKRRLWIDHNQTTEAIARGSRWTVAAPALRCFTRDMTAELQKLTKALDQIERRYPAGGKRYSTIVEYPYEAGYMPLPKLSKKAVAAGRRLRKARSYLTAK